MQPAARVYPLSVRPCILPPSVPPETGVATKDHSDPDRSNRRVYGRLFLFTRFAYARRSSGNAKTPSASPSPFSRPVPRPLSPAGVRCAQRADEKEQLGPFSRREFQAAEACTLARSNKEFHRSGGNCCVVSLFLSFSLALYHSLIFLSLCVYGFYRDACLYVAVSIVCQCVSGYDV